jgi:putative hemolysin
LIPTTLALGLGFLALLVLSGTFSGSETAFFSLSRIELRRFERSSSRRERAVAAAVARPERLLATILLGNTLVNVAGSSVMLALTRRLGDVFFGLDPVTASVVLATGTILVAGEITPKALAVHWPTRVAPVAVMAVAPLLKILTPPALILERGAFFFLNRLGVSEDKAGLAFGRRELQVLFEDIRKGQEISEDEGEIAANIFDFFETRAYEIMTPRVDLAGVPIDLPREELRRRVVAARHSRLPVYRGSLDQIIGFINTKEFLLEPDLPADALLRPVHFVPERARIHRILTEVQSRRFNLVVVVNEYGGTEGIITKEDLVETVVGEIFDEQEHDEAAPLERAGENLWRVDGLLPLGDLAAEVGLRTPEGPAQTVAGHVAHLLGRPPRPGDKAEDGILSYRVVQVRRHRAHRLLVQVKGPAPGTEAPR